MMTLSRLTELSRSPRTLLALPVGVAFAVTLAACGSSGSSSPTAPKPAAVPPWLSPDRRYDGARDGFARPC